MRRNRTVMGLCREFGVKVVRTSDWGVTYPVYGNPPTSWTYCSFDPTGSPIIVTNKVGSFPAPEDILHELCHLLSGPEALKDEGFLMPLQWAFIQRLVKKEFQAAIRDFESFGIGGVKITSRVRELLREPEQKPYVVAPEIRNMEVGEFPGETFTEIPEWEVMTQEAQRKGLLTKDGSPSMVANIPPLSAWQEYLMV